MSDLELVLTMLAEASTTDISNPKYQTRRAFLRIRTWHGAVARWQGLRGGLLKLKPVSR